MVYSHVQNRVCIRSAQFYSIVLTHCWTFCSWLLPCGFHSIFKPLIINDKNIFISLFFSVAITYVKSWRVTVKLLIYFQIQHPRAIRMWYQYCFLSFFATAKLWTAFSFFFLFFFWLPLPQTQFTSMYNLLVFHQLQLFVADCV